MHFVAGVFYFRPPRFGLPRSLAATAREVVTVEAIEGGTRLELAMSAQIPDDLPPETRNLMVNGGRAQIRLELENIKRLVEGSGLRLGLGADKYGGVAQIRRTRGSQAAGSI